MASIKAWQDLDSPDDGTARTGGANADNDWARMNALADNLMELALCSSETVDRLTDLTKDILDAEEGDVTKPSKTKCKPAPVEAKGNIKNKEPPNPSKTTKP
eukprot:431881-Rhodomonas_salina.1